jgi:hypothetical protein
MPLRALEPKSRASANSATFARCNLISSLTQRSGIRVSRCLGRSVPAPSLGREPVLHQLLG